MAPWVEWCARILQQFLVCFAPMLHLSMSSTSFRDSVIFAPNLGWRNPAHTSCHRFQSTRCRGSCSAESLQALIVLTFWIQANTWVFWWLAYRHCRWKGLTVTSQLFFNFESLVGLCNAGTWHWEFWFDVRSLKAYNNLALLLRDQCELWQHWHLEWPCFALIFMTL